MKSKFIYTVPFFLLIAGLYLLPVSIFEPDFSKIPGDLGDARFNNYILEHGHKYFSGEINSYWNAPFLFPYKNVTALSDNLLGALPVYSFFRILGTDRETSFLFWLITLFALNYICCFIALKQWSGNVILSSVGAYIFAFSIYNIGQLDHVQILPKFISPLVIFWWWKFISEKKEKYFLFVILGLVYQFYCGIYLAFMLAYILIFMLFAYCAVYRNNLEFYKFRNKRLLSYIVSVSIVAIVLLLPLLMPYI